jgi:hypothetical protein
MRLRRRSVHAGVIGEPLAVDRRAVEQELNVEVRCAAPLGAVRGAKVLELTDRALGVGHSLSVSGDPGHALAARPRSNSLMLRRPVNQAVELPGKGP